MISGILPKQLTRVVLMVLALMTMFATQVMAQESTATDLKPSADHYVAIHVDENDPRRMNLALNNVQNIRSHYDARGESVVIEVVTYGPGLHMFREDTSPVKDRIAAMSFEIDNLTFSACQNTLRAMQRGQDEAIQLIDESTLVPSGVVQLIELQEQGYSYIRP